MKKFILLSITLLFLACGASKNVRDSKKIIKGNWSLSKITYSKTGNYNVTLFNDASTACFEGSSWKFIPNNNTGIYTINNSVCATGDREFVFTIQEIDATTGLYNFLLKPANNDANLGFRLELAQLSDSFMQWQQTVTVDGEPFIINMNFTKQ